MVYSHWSVFSSFLFDLIERYYLSHKEPKETCITGKRVVLKVLKKNPPVFPDPSSALQSHCSSRAFLQTSVLCPPGHPAPCGLLAAVGPSQRDPQRVGSGGDAAQWSAPCSPGWQKAQSETMGFYSDVNRLRVHLLIKCTKYSFKEVNKDIKNAYL